MPPGFSHKIVFRYRIPSGPRYCPFRYRVVAVQAMFTYGELSFVFG